MATITQDLGAVTAYGYAKDAGYTGTEAEFTQLLGDLADTVADLEGLTVSISTLPAGSSATASYSNGVLSLGVPKGDKGDTGNTGATGPAAGFGTVSATVDSSVGTPSVEVSASGPDTAKEFAFAFHNLKGDKGDTGEVSEEDFLKVFPTDTASGPIASFPDGADGMPAKSLVINIEPVQSGSGDPSPENVRPISGWTGAKVSRTGFNVWDEEWEVGAYNTSTGAKSTDNTRMRCKNYIPVRPGETYYFNFPYVVGTYGFYWFYYDANKNYLGYQLAYGQTKTMPDNVYFITFVTQPTYGTTYNHDISINYPATETSYHAYAGRVIPITWQTEAGTVYGGTDEVVSGSGKKTMEIVDLGTLDWHNNGNDSVYADISGMMTNADSAICSHLKRVSASTTVSDMPNGSFKTYTNAGRIAVKYTGVTAQNAATMLAGMQFVYDLATPSDFSTTPITDLVSLYGQNNIFADCGPVDVEYRADIQLYIQKMIASALNA